MGDSDVGGSTGLINNNHITIGVVVYIKHTTHTLLHAYITVPNKEYLDNIVFMWGSSFNDDICGIVCFIDLYLIKSIVCSEGF